MQPGLSYDQAPPFHVPLRFFLTAPLFGVAAGLLLAWHGADALASRWSPGALALTHLLTLGFATMVMTGALTQILAVVAGRRIPRLVPIATLTHGGLTAGAAMLSMAFLLGEPALFTAAAALLGAAILPFAAAAGWATLRSPAQGPTVPGIRLALLALTITALIGGAMALQRGGWAGPAGPAVAYHATWGLAGWIGLLVAAVAYQVVPMFQQTPSYPPWMSRHFAPGLAGILAAWTAARLGDSGSVAGILAALAVLALTAFAVQTLLLQARRRRRTSDAAVLFWRVGLGCAIGAAGNWAWLLAVPAEAVPPWVPVMLGTLALAGATVSLICGMLYKIVPFLAWLHLQPLAGHRWRIPNMRELVPARAVLAHFWTHCAALAVLAAAVYVPDLARAAGAATAFAFSVMGWNLARASARYRSTRVRLEALARMEDPQLPR